MQNCEKMSADDVRLLLEFYRDNTILWNASHPQYRSHKKTRPKKDLYNHRDGGFQSKVSRKNSTVQEHLCDVKLNVSSRKITMSKNLQLKDQRGLAALYETIIFMKEEIERGKLYCSIINTC